MYCTSNVWHTVGFTVGLLDKYSIYYFLCLLYRIFRITDQ